MYIAVIQADTKTWAYGYPHAYALARTHAHGYAGTYISAHLHLCISTWSGMEQTVMERILLCSNASRSLLSMMDDWMGHISPAGPHFPCEKDLWDFGSCQIWFRTDAQIHTWHVNIRRYAKTYEHLLATQMMQMHRCADTCTHTPWERTLIHLVRSWTKRQHGWYLYWRIRVMLHLNARCARVVSGPILGRSHTTRNTMRPVVHPRDYVQIMFGIHAVKMSRGHTVEMSIVEMNALYEPDVTSGREHVGTMAQSACLCNHSNNNVAIFFKYNFVCVIHS